MRYNGPAIKAIRKKSGLSQTAIARSIGITQGHLGNIESLRDQPSDGLAMEIAAALGLEDLRAIIGEVPPDPIPVIGEPA